MKNKIEEIKRSKPYSRTLKLFIDMNKDISLLEEFLSFITSEDKGIRGKGYNYMNAVRVFEDIVMNNENNFVQLFEKYSLSKSQKEKTLIRRGEQEAASYIERLKSRPRPEVFSIYTTTYWENNGLSVEDAKEKVSEIQRENSNRRHAKSTQEDYKRVSPYVMEYYLNLGLDEEEARIQRNEFYSKSSCLTEDFYTSKYGQEIGLAKFRKRYSKRKNTMIEKYGQYVISSGRKSKSSTEFFAVLTKDLVDIGLDKQRIIGGDVTEKEFTRTDFDRERTYFYDYVLLDQKLIIEYNGLYWHAREGNEENWNSNIKTFDESIEYDKIKKNFIEEKGYVIIYVWEDENFDERRKEIIDYVKARLHR